MAEGRAPVRHVVLVVFDTLRRDAVGCYGTPPEWATSGIATPTSRYRTLTAHSRSDIAVESPASTRMTGTTYTTAGVMATP